MNHEGGGKNKDLNFKLLYAAACFLPSGGPIVTIYT